MNPPYQITVEVPDQDWGTVEGLKNLCGSPSPKNVRFQMFDNFVKAHMVARSEVCKECLEIFKNH